MINPKRTRATQKHWSMRKKIIFTIAVICAIPLAFFAIAAIVYGVAMLQTRHEFSETQTRCHSEQVVVGVYGIGDNYTYYRRGSSNNKPTLGAKYFCSNLEAENAGYHAYP